MYKKLLIFFLLSLQFLVVLGCSDRNSPEYAVNEIIKYYNNGDAVSFWNMRSSPMAFPSFHHSVNIHS